MKPGTPEYDKVYQEEMRKLETADSKADVKTKAKEETTPPEPDPVAELAKRVETAEKRVADTQKWGTQQSQKVAALERELANRRKAEEDEKLKPLFDANPMLKEAIEKTAGVNARTKDEVWLDQVGRAVPDVEELLNDPEFAAKANKRRNEIGDAWLDSITAIRELSELKTEHRTQKVVAAIAEQARKDFEEKSQKREAMQVPGNNGRRQAESGNDQAAEVARYANMSRADLDKERRKVLGY